MSYIRVFFILALSVSSLTAADLYVDPETGNDNNLEGPFKTISVALRRAKPGDTVHLKPIVYQDYAGFYGIQGEPGKPITLDGHGATLDGSDELDPDKWKEVEPGLYQADELISTITDAMIQRWFFLWNGKMIHMGRTSKGPRADLKAPDELLPGEWTFVKNEEKENAGSFFLKIEDGQSLTEQNIRIPTRSAGVQFGNGKTHNAHLVIKNITSTHVYNDGFNIHGHCEDVKFENIRSIECGDDGISAHGTAEYSVDGFVSIGNSTGICDTVQSKTNYKNVTIKECRGFDLFFLDSGTYSISDSTIESSAVETLVVTGRSNEVSPCRLKMDNVKIIRKGKPNTVRVEGNAVLTANNVVFENLSFRTKSAKVSFENSKLSGPRLEIFPDAEVEFSTTENKFDQVVNHN